MACSCSSASVTAAMWLMVCTKVYSLFFCVGVQSRWTLPLAAVAGLDVALVHRFGPF